MIESVRLLLQKALADRYAVGAFNVYNLEGALAVVRAAEAERAPVILQIHPASLRHGGIALVELCIAAAREARAPASVHLDHSSSEADIRTALAAGIRSIMVDGSAWSMSENIAFTRAMTQIAHQSGADVEAELGRLSGTEDGLTVAEWEACMTDPELAAQFANETGVNSLAVCIGNVHGVYRQEPRLDFDRLAAIRARTDVPLVLHGASGLPRPVVRRAIELGVAKLNINTELRTACLHAFREHLADPRADLAGVLSAATNAMQDVVKEKLHLFGSAGKA